MISGFAISDVPLSGYQHDYRVTCDQGEYALSGKACGITAQRVLALGRVLTLILAKP